MKLSIREEHSTDLDAIRNINRLAFGREEEADLVDALRRDKSVIASFVAIENRTEIVGHLLFTELPIILENNTLHGAALAPVAVLPDWQKRGVGSALIRHGLQACKALGVQAVVVLGHKAYYPRFGFSPETARMLHDPFSAGDAFMALELVPGALSMPGKVRYAPAFGIEDKSPQG